ncbi:protein SCO1/2 [Rhizobium sp. SG_E_25_P2]|jgi:protein SCO1|uniref:SCO family protein n=1 Tax=Rhizobium sp. SG_E_25_P2 TaxID=2879942 RepID=UPI002476F633|nr:SCO family protein [Rhizobium sp. SG_E_25_P2]MDH6267902.1 protein SCO1/2 [Rhizobium sp. SG_E_25_P2]
MKTVRIILFILAAMMAGLFFWLWQTAKQQETALSNEPFGAPFALTRQDGQPITEQAFRGKPTALFFGFTHCPEICPTTVYELSGWLKTVDPDKSKTQAYFVSIDPARDTPELLGTYLSNVTDRITGISGDPAKVEAMARSFKVFFKKVPSDPAKPDEDYTMDHTASVFLLDRQGRFAGTIAYGENPDVAVQKLKNLIARN